MIVIMILFDVGLGGLRGLVCLFRLAVLVANAGYSVVYLIMLFG